MKKILIVLSVLLLLAAKSPETTSTPADLVLRDGKIYTMDPARSWAEAVAIKDGRIVYVGDEPGLAQWIGPKTQTMDLRGRMVLPSFNDGHVHAVEAGIGMNRCALDNAQTKEEAFALIKKYAQEHPKAAWIVGQGWQLPIFPQANPQKEWLDAVVPDRPALLSAADGHSVWVNSKALQLAGITKNTPDPENGRIERNPAGEPSGTLRESAEDLVYKLVPPLTLAEQIAGLQSALKAMNGFGITGFQDARVAIDGKDPEGPVYREADQKGILTARVTGALYADPHGTVQEVLKQIPKFEKARREYQGKYFYPTAVKIFADGVIDTYTAAMLQPYENQKFSGELNWAPDKLNAFVDAAYAAKFQVHIHAIGDRAIRVSLSAIEAAEKQHGMRDARTVIAHLQMIDPADIPRFQQLHVIPCFQPIWAYVDSYMRDLELPKLGPQRSRWVYPMRSVVNTGATLAFGSDWSVSSVNPLDGIEVAVTRQDPDGPADANSPFVPEERLDLQTALAGYTIGSAYSNFWEKETGSLEAGKSADLIVLSQNLFDIPASKINQTKVLLTLFEGRTIFKSPEM